MNKIAIQQFQKYCTENIEENKKDKLKFTIQMILIIVGVINIICANFLKEKMAIIIGITIIIISTINLVKNIKQKEYKTLDTLKVPENVVSIILGIMTLLKQQNAVSFIAIIWGVSGLRKGMREFNIALYNKVHNKNFIAEIIHATIETALSIALIFDPFEKVEEHIIILGIEMIISALKIALYNENEYEKTEE